MQVEITFSDAYLTVTDVVNATSQHGVSISALTKASELPTQSSSLLSLPAAGPAGKLLMMMMMMTTMSMDIQQFIFSCIESITRCTRLISQ